jgi:hypothetical protein
VNFTGVEDALGDAALAVGGPLLRPMKNAAAMRASVTITVTGYFVLRATIPPSPAAPSPGRGPHV